MVKKSKRNIAIVVIVAILVAITLTYAIIISSYDRYLIYYKFVNFNLPDFSLMLFSTFDRNRIISKERLSVMYSSSASPSVTFSISVEDPDYTGVGAMEIDKIGYKGRGLSSVRIELYKWGKLITDNPTDAEDYEKRYTDTYGLTTFRYLYINFWDYKITFPSHMRSAYGCPQYIEGEIRISYAVSYWIFIDCNRGVLGYLIGGKWVYAPGTEPDTTPPVVSNPYPAGTESSPTQLTVGDTIKLGITATDARSGVKDVVCTVFDITSESSYPQVGDPNNLQAIGNDVWEADWTVPDILNDGAKIKFYFAAFDSVDNVGSVTTYATISGPVIPPPPPKPDIWATLNNIWQNFIDWVKNLLSGSI